LQWVQEKVGSITQGAITAYHETVAAVNEVVGFLHVDTNRAVISKHLTQFWNGFSRFTDLTIPISLLTSRHKTLKALFWSQYALGARMLKLLGYHAGIRAVAQNVITHATAPALANAACAATGGEQLTLALAQSLPVQSWGAYVAENATMGALDIAASLYFTREAVTAMLADTPAYGAAIAHASAEESVDKGETTNPLMKHCKHSEVACFTAGIASTVNYFITYMFFWTVSNAPQPYRALFILPEALFYGRTILEYPLAAAGNCTEHRRKVLDANHAYAGGLGLSYLAFCWGIKKLLTLYTPLPDDGFVNQVVGTSVWFYFIVLANCSRSLPLPGKLDEPGYDYFKPSRMATEWLGDKVKKKFFDVCNNVQETDSETKALNWYEATKGAASSWWSWKPTKLARWLLLKDGFESSYTFANRDSSRVYLDVSKDFLVKVVEGIQQKREDNWNVFFDTMFFLPIGPNNRKKLTWLMDKYLEQPLNDWHRFFQNPYEDPGIVAAKPAAQVGTMARLKERAPVKDTESVVVASSSDQPSSLGSTPVETSPQSLIPMPRETKGSQTLFTRKNTEPSLPLARPAPPDARPLPPREVQTSDSQKRPVQAGSFASLLNRPLQPSQMPPSAPIMIPK
jgi:hypothetical protein